MTAVHIPFLPRFQEPLLSGVKTCTTRTSRLGLPGDEFVAFGAWFLIRSVEKVELGDVANNLFEQEGVSSSNDFITIWLELHRSFIPTTRVWLHRFEKKEEGI